ncbi:unnamed protein product [Cyprideis torosa]|uniref:Uncharacterized protein n=1 Tax=Cyprideis torosa TaxID=163714 RepID=A0A7R8W768_9CRUS|nr:unnamed protein product [Cyprideis torosa]CAG0882085.1 unnamed protein product [Cyprideis torosa]
MESDTASAAVRHMESESDTASAAVRHMESDTASIAGSELLVGGENYDSAFETDSEAGSVNWHRHLSAEKEDTDLDRPRAKRPRPAPPPLTFKGSKVVLRAEEDADWRRRGRQQVLGLNAYDRHKLFINTYILTYPVWTIKRKRRRARIKSESKTSSPICRASFARRLGRRLGRHKGDSASFARAFARAFGEEYGWALTPAVTSESRCPMRWNVSGCIRKQAPQQACCATKLFERDASRDRNDFTVLEENHRFVWTAKDEVDSWEAKLAKKYYDKLFHEYGICDLRYHQLGKVAIRWQTEAEVVSGKGQFTCAEKFCKNKETSSLRTWEVNFAYVEKGEKRNTLVKLRLCPECSVKLNYKSQRREVKKKRRMKEKTKGESSSKKPKTEEGPEVEGEKDERQEEAEQEKAREQEDIWNREEEAEPTEQDEFEKFFDDLLIQTQYFEEETPATQRGPPETQPREKVQTELRRRTQLSSALTPAFVASDGERSPTPQP